MKSQRSFLHRSIDSIEAGGNSNSHHPTAGLKDETVLRVTFQTNYRIATLGDWISGIVSRVICASAERSLGT